jgi:signal transduction histidine kinase
MAGPFQRVKPLILIADDQEAERFLLREVLEPAGFDIVEAEDGPAALQLFAEWKPDLVMLDVMMPAMNGFDVCQAIRKLPGGRNTPILMATALDDIESIDESYRVGATDFIGKPIKWAVLPHHVRYMLRAYETVKNLIMSEHRLAEAQRIAGLGSFRWLPHAASIQCSAELCRMFGLGEHARTVSVRSLLRRVHAADRRAVIQAVRGGLAGERIDLDHRVVTPGGEVRTLALRAEPITWGDETGFLQGSFQDISERKRIEVELATARDQARSADHAKTAFLAAMSHELRTPLNAIIGFSDLIAQQAFGPISQGRYIDYARNAGKAGQQMLSVVNDVLMIAQLEADRFELVLETVDLAEPARATVAAFRRTEAGAAHDIAVAVRGAPRPVRADERAVTQILQKLLSNAAKFSASGTAIDVTIGPGSGACTRLSVVDRGIGITAEMAELALRPFRQADGWLARKYEGTRLGLSIVNALIERHGGRLTIDSVPGQGTCVSVDLPSVCEDERSWRKTTGKPQSATLAAG